MALNFKQFHPSMILNRQRGIRIRVRELERFTARTIELLRLPAGCVTVCLVADREMTRWNRTYRGKDRPTDVLSFPSDDNNGKKTRRARQGARAKREILGAAEAGYLGDIAIAPRVARDNAVRFGRAFEDEMRILILHGILHLMGYDHETDNGEMERRESRLRRKLGLI